jgi:hypothetical protein
MEIDFEKGLEALWALTIRFLVVLKVRKPLFMPRREGDFGKYRVG